MDGIEEATLPFKHERLHLLKVIGDARRNIRTAQEMLAISDRPVFWLDVLAFEQESLAWATKRLAHLKREWL